MITKSFVTLRTGRPLTTTFAPALTLTLTLTLALALTLSARAQEGGEAASGQPAAIEISESGAILIQWNTQADHRYRILVANALEEASDSWTLVPAAFEIIASGAMTDFQVTAPTLAWSPNQPRRFYRIEAAEYHPNWFIFEDPETGVRTTAIHDVDEEIVRANTTNDSLVWDADGEAYLPFGFPVSPDGLHLSRTSNFWVRFGTTENGARKAYFTETRTGTICDISQDADTLFIFPTSVFPPGTAAPNEEAP